MKLSMTVRISAFAAAIFSELIQNKRRYNEIYMFKNNCTIACICFFSSCSNHNDNEIKGITSNTSSINEMAEERSNILTTTESAMATQTNSTYLTTDTDSISAISGTNTTEAKSIHMISCAK